MGLSWLMCGTRMLAQHPLAADHSPTTGGSLHYPTPGIMTIHAIINEPLLHRKRQKSPAQLYDYYVATETSVHY